MIDFMFLIKSTAEIDFMLLIKSTAEFVRGSDYYYFFSLPTIKGVIVVSL